MQKKNQPNRSLNFSPLNNGFLPIKILTGLPSPASLKLRWINSAFRRSGGFTLIELLVVIVIIGVLATLSTITLSGIRLKARDAKRLSDIRQIQTALEMYFNSEDSYPTVITSGRPLVGVNSGHTFFSRVPNNPTPSDGSCAINSEYTYSGSGSNYLLTYCLGNNTSGLLAGLNYACPGTISSANCNQGSVCPNDMTQPCPSSPAIGCQCGGGIVFDATNKLISSPSHCINSTTCDGAGVDTLYLNWTSAGTFCSNLNINGQTSWRLPTGAELHNLCLAKASIGDNFDTSHYYFSSTNDGYGATAEAMAGCSIGYMNFGTQSSFRCIKSY